jgi:tRNA pseudouridine38-40 synthase
LKNSDEPALYKSTVAYDGTDFKGFQRQGQAERTVQGVLERALQALRWGGSSLRAAGRTDSGVHASGQVVAFNLAWDHSTKQLSAALNANLPHDVAIRDTETAAEGFDPRRSASGRRYSYRLLIDEVPDPLHERYAWRIWPPIDIDRLAEASSVLIGRHDFGAFGKAPTPGGHTVRELRRADWQLEGEQLNLIVEADAFLYHMVRRVVGALLRVASGKAKPADLELSLSDPRTAWNGRMAPARGLCLEAVLYED